MAHETEGDERLTLTVSEAASLLGIARATAYECIRTGEIPSITLGRRILVPRGALERLLAAAQEMSPSNDDTASASA
ncbi:MAG: helix-turn-helix domain-containing protein [bacterium]|nr:helix-turn-helix domain-containing protein [bacterium]